MATEQDLNYLHALIEELDAAGRIDEARSVARAYAALSVGVYPELLELPDDDPELVEMLAESERDFAEGRWSTHEAVKRRIQALDDA